MLSSFIINCYLLLGSIAMISALLVVSAKNPIHRIAALVIVYISGAFIFMILDFYFLGLTNLIVYVGAIAILFLFVIMMVPISPGQDEIKYIKRDKNDYKNSNSNSIIRIFSPFDFSWIPTPTRYRLVPIQMKYKNINENKNNYILTTFIVFFIILFPIFISISYTNNIIPFSYDNLFNFFTNFNEYLPIYSYFYPIWAIEYKTITDIESLAIIVYVAYPTALILIGLALWTVMIGIISICSPRL